MLRYYCRCVEALFNYLISYFNTSLLCVCLQETEQLRARRQMERKHSHMNRADTTDGLDEDKFDRFVHTAR